MKSGNNRLKYERQLHGIYETCGKIIRPNKEHLIKTIFLIVVTVMLSLIPTILIKGEQSALAVPPRPMQQLSASIAPQTTVAEKNIEIEPLNILEVKTFNKDDPTTYPVCTDTEQVNLETGICEAKPVETPVEPPVAVAVAPVGKGGVETPNLYDWGNCTWYVKNRRPDIPNTLGNADTWYYYAKAQGLPVGSEPRVGAAAQQKGVMHVVYVEAVNGDGTINISEMNVLGLNVISFRNALASDFNYIY